MILNNDECALRLKKNIKQSILNLGSHDKESRRMIRYKILNMIDCILDIGYPEGYMIYNNIAEILSMYNINEDKAHEFYNEKMREYIRANANADTLTFLKILEVV